VEDGHLIFGHNLRRILVKCSCCGGMRQNVDNSFSSMACFEALPVGFRFLNKHFARRSPCSSFAKAPVPTVVRGVTDMQDGGERSGHPLGPLRPGHLDDRGALVSYHAPASLLSVQRGSEVNADNMSSSVYLTLCC